MTPTQFKLLSESCSLSIAQAADFLELPFGTASKYATGQRSTPPEIIEKLQGWFLHIDAAACAFARHDFAEALKRIEQSDLPRQLKRAALRRFYEINAAPPKKKAGKK